MTTTAPILIRIPGTPKGEPRHRARAAKVRGQWMAMAYPSHSADDWKAVVALFAKRHRPRAPLAGPVRVDITFAFPRPKEHYRTGRHAGELKPGVPVLHTAKPDRDNAEKLILDQLTKLKFWLDDAQVCAGEVVKVYPGPGEAPGAVIRITPLTGAGGGASIIEANQQTTLFEAER